MHTRIIAEIGSTHCGFETLAKQAVDKCVDMGVDAIKFQLFGRESEFAKNNIWLDPELYQEISGYAKLQGLEIGASVFDDESLDFLLSTHPDFVKFAYSQKERIGWIREVLNAGIETIVSCDVMSDKKVPIACTRLFCIPQYPVYFHVCFDEIFPRFNGFSDHTMGFEQTIEAVSAGAKVIEKHMRIDPYDFTTPDSQFALSPAEFSAMVASIRSLEK